MAEIKGNIISFNDANIGEKAFILEIKDHSLHPWRKPQKHTLWVQLLHLRTLSTSHRKQQCNIFPAFSSPWYGIFALIFLNFKKKKVLTSSNLIYFLLKTERWHNANVTTLVSQFSDLYLLQVYSWESSGEG